MKSPAIGQVPPSFRLPSGQGPHVGPEDYRGRSNLIVWFTKGMACAFCRQHMSQLLRGYPAFRSLNTEILEVTPTTPDRGRLYASKFNIPFPYLCDPDHGALRSWGLDVRSHSIGWYARALYTGFKAPEPPSDFGKLHPSFGEMPKLVADEDMGFFILDKNSVIRFALAGSYIVQTPPTGPVASRAIPSNDEIVRELERCGQALAR